LGPRAKKKEKSKSFAYSCYESLTEFKLEILGFQKRRVLTNNLSYPRTSKAQEDESDLGPETKTKTMIPKMHLVSSDMK
jgi:hypothetical protein